MPNLRLSDQDIAALIRYLEEESRKLAPAKAHEEHLGHHAATVRHGDHGDAQHERHHHAAPTRN